MTRISNITEGSSNGFFLTTGADAVVKMWDARKIKFIGELKTGMISDLLCQQNAIVTSSSTGLLKLWMSSQLTSNALPEARTAREWSGIDLAQHSSSSTDLVSGPDFIAASSKSGQILRWINN